MASAKLPLSIEAAIGLKMTLRYWRRHWLQSALLVLVLGLGVGSFLSIRLANRAASASFGHFTDTLTGEPDWVLQPTAGSLDETALRTLREKLGTRAVHLVPVLEGSAMLERSVGRPSAVTLIGLDLVGIANLGASGGTVTGLGGKAIAGTGVRVWLSKAAGLAQGATLYLRFGDRRIEALVAGVVEAPEGAPALAADVLVLDLPTLQELGYRKGQLDRIELRVEPGALAEANRAEAKEKAEEASEGLWTVISPRTRRETGDMMTRAFQLNLGVLSLIALLVGLYLIYQAMDGAVVRRRQEAAILKSLGLTERALRLAWLLESLLMGLAGGVVGIVFGVLSARASVEAVGQTVNALYFASTVKAAGLGAGEGALALLLGAGASVVAGWIPARRAAMTDPARLLVRHEAPQALVHPGRWLAIGVGLLVTGVVCSRLPGLILPGGGRFPLAGYAAALAWIVGSGLVFGGGLSLVGRGLRGGSSASARIAGSYLTLPSSRHRLAVSALVCAVGMTAGMAVLVASFDRSVRAWIEQSLSSDIYIAASGRLGAGPSNRMAEATWRSLANQPEVAEVAPLSIHSIELNGLPTQLVGGDLVRAGRRSVFVWVTRPADDRLFDLRQSEGLALATESFCERYLVGVGSIVSVPTPSGFKKLEIVGVTADYGNERGSLTVDLHWVQAWFREDTLTHIALTLKPGADAKGVMQRLKAQHPWLVYYENAALRAEILRIFRQTFGITYSLEILGLVVALAGLAMTMASLLLERTDVLTTMRGLGFSRREMAAATAWEGWGVSTVAAVGGLSLSLALGWLLVFVINKQSFGWTLQFAVPVWGLVALAASVIVTGTVVSVVLGRWGAALPADREE